LKGEKIHMSHYSVAVFTEPNGKSVEELLAPFHEFECTGTVDQYVQSVDQTEEARNEYAGYTFTKLKDQAGKLHDPYDDEFYREPTEEEKKTVGMGSGCGNGISWASKDWGDGKGYRAKVKFTPDGHETVEIEAEKFMSFRDFIEYYYCRKPVFEGEEPDMIGEHKYGWMRLNASGEVIELIDRTNPDAKWDWWTDGGRYGGRLLVKSEETADYPSAWNCSGRKAIAGYAWVDSAKFSDIQWDVMAQQAVEDRKKYWDEADGKEDFIKSIQYGIEKGMTRDEYINKGLSFGTFAVIMPDGNWYERGKMGWWACVSNEEEAWDEKYKERFLDNASPDWTLTIVDCHI
jgi:hypothetical protein